MHFVLKKLFRKFTLPNRNKIKSVMKNSKPQAKDESIEIVWMAMI